MLRRHLERPGRPVRPVATIRGVLGLGALALVVLAGCGPATTPDAASTAASTATAGTVEAGSATGDTVPRILDFSAPLVGGGTFSAADQAGRATVFWFWAPT